MTVCDVCGYPMTAVFFSPAYVCMNCDHVVEMPEYQSSATGPRVDQGEKREKHLCLHSGQPTNPDTGKRAS